MKKLFILSCILICILQSVSATQQNFHQRISINGTDAGMNAAELIRLLAEGYNKPPRSTQFTLEFDQHLLVNAGNASASATITSGRITVSGDHDYRGFDLSNFLYPDEIVYTIHISAGSYKKDVNVHCKVRDGIPDPATAAYPDSAEQQVSITMSNFTAHYINTSTVTAQQHVNLINDYYKASTETDQHAALLSVFDAYDYEHFRENSQVLRLNIQYMQETEARHYEQDLSLIENDPARLLDKIRAYKNLLQNKKSQYDQVMLTLYLLFYDRGNVAMHNHNIPLAEHYYKNSFEINPRFAPSLLELARIDYINRQFYEAQCKADDILFQLTPDPQTRTAVIDLLKDIYETHLEMGEAYVQSKRYTDAVSHFEIAEMICKKYGEIHCSDNLYSGTRKARTGIYQNYLDDARQQIQRNDFSRAEILINQAVAYHDAYRNELAASTEAAELLHAVRQKKYEQVMYGGQQFDSRGNYEQALQQFQLADSMITIYNLQPLDNALFLKQQTVRNLISQHLLKGKENLDAGLLPKAVAEIKIISDMQHRYQLENDNGITSSLQTLQGKIFTQQCLDMQHKIEDAYSQSKSLISQLHYSEAAAELKKEIAISEQNSACMLSTDSAGALLEKIRPAAGFQDLLQEGKQADYNGDYGKALTLYDQASVLYREAGIDQFGLVHNPSLQHYITVDASNGLVNYTATQYAEKGQLDESLALYKLLVSRNYDSKLLAGSLYRLGLLLGRRDIKQVPGGKAKMLAKQYTGNDKKLKRLVKGYTRGYR